MRRQLFTLLLAVPLTAGAQIFSVSSERTVALPDSTSQVAAISPRGDFLLLTDAENNGLRKYDLATGAITPITTASGAGYGVELSADGTKAVYREITYDQHHLRYTSLHVADLSGGKSRQVVKPTRSLQGYSVDGGQLSTTQAGMSRSRVIAGGSSVSTSRPALSIDNGQLMISRDGGEATVFSPLGTDKSYIWPSLSPSGSKVLFYVGGEGAYVCSLDGTNPVSLGILRAPKWYDDNTVVGMYDEDDGVAVYASRIIAATLDGRRQTLSPDSIVAMYPQVAPEAGRITYSTPEGGTRIIDVKK